ncbi:MAG: hypothetical protein L6367_11565, partial [Cellulomonas sp.]|nr:hypothetical protein [Cellulomonas sp.]
TTEPAATQEVLPGESFSVRTVVAGVAPALLDTAVVDVTMSAAPGPATELPLVSSSARTAFPAIPWTGLALLALLAGAAWWVLRIRRRRREEGEAMWAELVDHARAGELPARPGAGGAPAVQAFVLAAVLLAGALGAVLSSSAPAQAAVLPGAEPTLSLTVPAAPTTTPTVTETTATATATATAAATTTTTTTTTTTGGTAGSTTSGTRRSTASPSASDPAVESQVLADESTPTPTPTVLAADTVWHQTSGFTPMQRALVAVSGALLLGAAGLGVRALILARTARVAA